MGTLEQALGLAREERANDERCFALTYIARAQRVSGDIETSQQTFREARTCADNEARDNLGFDARDRLRQLVACQQAEAGDGEGALATFDAMKDNDLRMVTLAGIAPFATIASRIGRLKKPVDQAWPLAERAAAEAAAGSADAKKTIAAALKMLGTAKKPPIVRYWITRAELALGDLEAATASASACSTDEGYKHRACEEVALALVAAGQLPAARALLKKLKDGGPSGGCERGLLALAYALAEAQPDAARSLLDEAAPLIAESHKTHQPHYAKDVALVRMRLGDDVSAELKKCLAAAQKLEAWCDPWWIALEIGLARHARGDGAGARADLALAGKLAAKDDWTADMWVQRNQPNGFDKLWRVVRVQASIDEKGALATAALRKGGRRAAALAEAVWGKHRTTTRADSGGEWSR
jgi:hypothetical protein